MELSFQKQFGAFERNSLVHYFSSLIVIESVI